MAELLATPQVGWLSYLLTLKVVGLATYYTSSSMADPFVIPRGG